MTDDIVTRLREWDDQQPPFRIMFEAADDIERLRAAGDALVAAIRNHMLSEKDIRAWKEVRGE